MAETPSDHTPAGGLPLFSGHNQRLKPNRRQEGIALALILGGAVGNLFDRIFRGEVIDFLLFYYQGWSFPVFNIADIAINIGAALLILDLVGWQVISNRNKHEK